MRPPAGSGWSDARQDVNALMRAADAADRKRDFPTAIKLCGQILDESPDFVPAKLLSAVVHLKAGHSEAAEEKLVALLADHPDNFGALLWLGTLYARHRRFEEAITCAERALTVKPQDPDARFLLARVLFEDDQLSPARDALQAVLEVRPRSAEAHSMLGSVLQQLGDLQAASDHLRQAIQLEPKVGPAYYDLVLGLRVQEGESDVMALLENAVKQEGLLPRDRARMEFALGKAYDDLGHYESAMRHFDLANSLALEVMKRFGREFDPIRLANDFRVARESFEIAADAPAGSSSTKPVFIVGMMRSGTTLLEQIVSSHPEVEGAGELNFWFDRLGPFHQEERPPRAEEAAALADAYLKVLDRYGPEALRVTDKTPHNFIGLGWIRSIFPNARFIHCRRTVIDSSLSIYMTPFRVPPEFGHSKANIVTFAKHYQKLMAFWRSVLPSDQFLEVDYEKLVAEPEPQIRRVIDFLGLSWSESCLQHMDNQKTVRTPSLWQVRQPVYQTSVERWRRYEPWLDEFRELLP